MPQLLKGSTDVRIEMGKLRDRCGYRDDNRQKDEQVDATGAHFVNVASSLATLTSPGLSLVFISMR